MIRQAPPRRLLARLLGGTLAPTLLALTAVGLLAHEVARRVLEDELGRRLALAAAGTAGMILPEQMAALATEDGASLPLQNVQRRLATARTRFGVRRLVLVSRAPGRGAGRDRARGPRPARPDRDGGRGGRPGAVHRSDAVRAEGPRRAPADDAGGDRARGAQPPGGPGALRGAAARRPAGPPRTPGRGEADRAGDQLPEGRGHGVPGLRPPAPARAGAGAALRPARRGPRAGGRRGKRDGEGRLPRRPARERRRGPAPARAVEPGAQRGGGGAAAPPWRRRRDVARPPRRLSNPHRGRGRRSGRAARAAREDLHPVLHHP